MAGRPRLYANAAQKTAAYRARQEKRLVVRDRVTQEYLEADVRRLLTAVNAAASAGDGLAQSLNRVSWIDLLDSLSAHFEERSKCSE